jgi:hypothetical protein
MKIGSLWMLVASMVSNLRAQSGIARGVDAILEECAAAAYGCGEKGSLQDKPQSSARQAQYSRVRIPQVPASGMCV